MADCQIEPIIESLKLLALTLRFETIVALLCSYHSLH